jgi:DNA invertase Pin-like site-specific DNA recombinase
MSYDPISVECPFCKAKVGEPCSRSNGTIRGPHYGLDLTTPSGRLMFQIIGAMAEFERALIQERVKAGLAHAREKGVRLGRRKTPVNTSRVEVLRALGLSWGKVAEEVGASIPTIQRAMRARTSEAVVAATEEPDVLHV